MHTSEAVLTLEQQVVEHEPAVHDASVQLQLEEEEQWHEEW